jgi:hypothetical protein
MPFAVNSASEELLNDPALLEGLSDQAFAMLVFHSPVPDPAPSQGTLPSLGNVDYDIASVDMAADVRYCADIDPVRRKVPSVANWQRVICPFIQYLPELSQQGGAHDAATLVAAIVAADQYDGMVDLAQHKSSLRFRCCDSHLQWLWLAQCAAKQIKATRARSHAPFRRHASISLVQGDSCTHKIRKDNDFRHWDPRGGLVFAL